MKTYWISLYLDISNKDNLKKYGEKAIPVIKSYGGKPIVRGGKLTSFSDTKIVRTVIWEFPSYDDAMSCHESTDYKSAWSCAEGTTKRIMFIVGGVDQKQI